MNNNRTQPYLEENPRGRQVVIAWDAPDPRSSIKRSVTSNDPDTFDLVLGDKARLAILFSILNATTQARQPLKITDRGTDADDIITSLNFGLYDNGEEILSQAITRGIHEPLEVGVTETTTFEFAETTQEELEGKTVNLHNGANKKYVIHFIPEGGEHPDPVEGEHILAVEVSATPATTATRFKEALGQNNLGQKDGDFSADITDDTLVTVYPIVNHNGSDLDDDPIYTNTTNASTTSSTLALETSGEATKPQEHQSFIFTLDLDLPITDKEVQVKIWAEKEDAEGALEFKRTLYQGKVRLHHPTAA